jgi:hypothetical protein
MFAAIMMMTRINGGHQCEQRDSGEDELHDRLQCDQTRHACVMQS